MYNIIADLHTHTIASTHAYSTVAEMVSAAEKIGLYAIGITDHGHKMPGAPGPWYFECLRHLPLIEKGVKLISGMETNIVDFEGNLDYEERDDVNLLIASIHDIPGIDLQNPDIDKCTELYLAVARNPRVNIIGHSGTPKFAYDFDRVIPEFGRNNKLVEINSHTFAVRPKSVENCRKIALCCKKHLVPIVVNSDAHYYREVGDFRAALKLLEDIDFPQELILNSSRERLDEYLSLHTNINTNRIV